MCIPHEHPSVSVTTNESYFRNTQAHLKEPADCLVSESPSDKGGVWG